MKVLTDWMRCQFCGEDLFYFIHWPGRKPKYCSSACKNSFFKHKNDIFSLAVRASVGVCGIIDYNIGLMLCNDR